MSRDVLEKRVAMLEKKLGARRKPVAKPSARQTLAAEITELERRLNAMSYMDEDELAEEDVDIGIDTAYMDELGLDDLEAEPVMMDEATVIDEVGDVVEPAMDDDMDELEDEAFCGEYGMRGSETKPGVEDRITQDYLSDVEGEEHGEELTTDPSMLDTASTDYRASAEYVSRLKKASARLDKVASYLEKNGRIELAKRIDAIADAIDARINRRA